MFNQSQREGNGGKGNGNHIGLEDSRINAEVFGKTEQFGGFEYSALIGLSGNPDDGNVQENRIKLKNEWGTLIGGNTRGVDDFMAFGGFSVMGATGGFAGNYTNILNQTTGTIVTTNLAGASKDATKIIYVTPRINGVQAGIHFVPSAAHKGDHKLQSASPSGAKSLPFDKNQVGVGINFKETFSNGFDVKLSATSLLGTTQAPARLTVNQPVNYRNTQAYAIGAQFGYQGWEIGGEFIDNGKSQTPKQKFSLNGNNIQLDPVSGNDAGKAYDIALAYTYQKHKFALGYYGSSRKVETGYKKARTSIYSVTWDRKLAPGLGVYIGANRVIMKTDDRAATDQANFKAAASKLGLSTNDLQDGVKSNQATIIEVGTKLRF
jgi:hypothetical protein